MNPIVITYAGNNQLNIKMPYNPEYIQKIKRFSSYMWIKEKKLWRIGCSMETINKIQDFLSLKI